MNDAPASRPTLPTRQRWKAMLPCAIIFLAGLVIGGSAVVIYDASKPWPPPRKTLEERTDHLTDRIAEKVGLDRRQRDQLRQVVSQRLETIMEMREEFKPHMMRQAELLNERTLAITETPDQKQRWKKLYRQLFRKWFEEDPYAPATQTEE
jgi:hypothetical protein